MDNGRRLMAKVITKQLLRILFIVANEHLKLAKAILNLTVTICMEAEKILKITE
ncbi:MAG: hypothetical protein KBE38_10530 [Ignavibacterium sp.]|nr:hypothetical protein [Ignavibacterium sp.]